MPQQAGTLPTPAAPQQGQDKMQILAQLLKSFTPALAGLSGGQPQATPMQTAPAAPPSPVTPAPSPAQMQTKFDPMANVGTLPSPVMQPSRPGYQAPSGSAELLSKLDPKGASIYQGVQGVTKYITDTVQRLDQKKQAEAQNAAQALMSALEGAKTTGDYSPAQHIFENNEALFNKVFKGWMQKADEAKKESQKPKKEAKKPDPEIQGFEKGLAEYLGKGGANQPGAPKPPQTLQGRSGASYFLPVAGPQQASAQQDASARLQQQRQDPGSLKISPADQIKLNEAAVQYAKLNADLQKSQDEVKKTQLEYDTAVQKTKTGDQEAQAKLDEAKQRLEEGNQRIQELKIRQDIAKQEGQIRLARAKTGGQIPIGFQQRYQSMKKAYDIVDKIVKEKRANPTSEEQASVTNLLKQAGAPTLAAAVPGWWSRVAHKTGMGGDNASELLQEIRTSKQSMENVLSERASWLDDSSTDSSEPIVVSPEDLK